ncbi:MAG: glycosyltransferase [Bacteroidaceae bacterium]|nr:glycosyltransferase [Bacteroidaceae bacterium]
MDKKKILFINGHLNAGGVERSLVDVLRHFDYGKYEVDLLLLEGTGDYLEEIPQNVNVIMYSLNDAGGPLLSTCWKNLVHGRWVLLFYRFLMLLSSKRGNEVMRWARPMFCNGNRRYNVVIGYRPNMATTFAAYTFHADRRLAWWHHGEMNICGRHRIELAHEYERMDAVIAVSESSAQLVKETFPDIKEKVRVIPNMLCVEEIREKAQSEVINMSSACCNIISVGRMSPEKNMAFCVDVAWELRERMFSFHWYMVGDGVDMELVKRKIEKNNLTDWFTITGNLPNPYPYIQSADLLFHPSLVESQGLTVLEAMALGTPVVVVESAGPKEFIENGVNGIMIVAEVGVAASTIEKLCREKILLQDMVENGRNTIAVYESSKIMKQIYIMLDVETPIAA